MKLRHRLARKYWLAHWEKRSRDAFGRLGSEATELERVELAISMLWPFARKVFLMHRFDELPYSTIAELLRIDERTIEICIVDTLRVVAAARRDEYW